MRSMTCDGTSNDSETVLPVPASCSEFDQRLQLGLLAGLQLRQRQEALDDIAEVLAGLLVARLGADVAAHAAVDVAVRREPPHRGNLADDAFGQLGLADEGIEPAHGPGVAVVHVLHEVHHLAVGEDALAALAIDRVLDDAGLADADEARADEGDGEAVLRLVARTRRPGLA